MKIGYARISTKSQLENYSLEQQEKALLSEGCTLVYKEQFTGTTTDRPVFNEVKAILMENADSGEKTILVVTKLDRFARTTVEGMKIMQELLDVGVAVHILNFGNITGGFNSTNKLMFSIFMAFAEYERDMIVERCQSGKETARSKPNFKDGRPNKYTKDQMDLALELKKDNSYKKIERMTGISKSTLIREMRRRKLITL